MMTKKVATLFHMFLSVVVFSDALFISPVTLKMNQINRGRAVSSSPFHTEKLGKSLRNGVNGEKKNRIPTNLSMYNLPPGGGGGKNDIADIAKGAATLLLTIGFFISPLGGLVLGLFNSFLVLLFVLPALATVGFQVWQKFNTISAPCPECQVEVTVMKNKDTGNTVDSMPAPQSMCFQCGCILQANEDNTGINNVSGRKTVDDLNAPMGSGGIFDVFSVGGPTVSRSTSSSTSAKKDGGGEVDKSAAIDVDVLDDDKPFQ